MKKEDKAVGIPFIALAIGIFIFLADALSKYFVDANLPTMNHHYQTYPYGGIPVFRDFFGIEFSISHTTNRGAAWGMLSSYQSILLGFRIVLVFGLIIYTQFINTVRRYALPLVLIISGAVANIADNFVYGHVVDMLHFVLWGYDFPVFNIADASISIGVAWMVILGFIGDRKPSSSSPLR